MPFVRILDVNVAVFIKRAPPLSANSLTSLLLLAQGTECVTQITFSVLGCALIVHSLVADISDSKYALEVEDIIVPVAIKKVFLDPLVLDW